MGTTTTSLVKKSLDKPEEVRRFAGHGFANIANLARGPVLRAHYQPGWKWSQDVGPLAGTDSCQATHVGYVISGRMRIRMNDGTEQEFRSGDLMEVGPGHDGWTVGGEECIVLDWGPSVAKFAKK